MPISGIAGSIAGRGVWEGGKTRLSDCGALALCAVVRLGCYKRKAAPRVGALVPPACQDQAGNPFPFIFSKPGLLNAGFSTSVAIPSCEVRAAKYLAEKRCNERPSTREF